MANEIIYFFDPICGWCYGFSSHFSAFYDAHKDDYALKVITGGMVRNEQVVPIRDKADYLREAYIKVEEMSGAKFGQAFLERLEEGSTNYGSDVASLVFHALSIDNPVSRAELAKEIQQAIYIDGVDPMDINSYVTIAGKYDITPSELERRVASEDVQLMYESDLYTTQQFGVAGFPFAIVQLDGEYYQLARGFRSHEELEIILEKAIEYHRNREERSIPG